MALGLGRILQSAAPLAAFIPGVGPLAAAGIAVGGSLLGEALTNNKVAGVEEMRRLAAQLQNPNFGLEKRIAEIQGLAVSPQQASAQYAQAGFGRASASRLGLASSQANRLGLGTNVARAQGNYALDNLRLSTNLYSGLAGLDLQQQAVRDANLSQGLGAAAFRLGLGLGNKADLGTGAQAAATQTPTYTLPNYNSLGVAGPGNPYGLGPLFGNPAFEMPLATIKTPRP